MQNKIKSLFGVLVGLFVIGMMTTPSVVAEEIVEEEAVFNDDIAADAIEDYQVEGSLFQQITDLEQEKVLMQLEKERAQLNLDLDKLAAEKIKLHMEIDTLSGQAEQRQQEFETERARLQAEAKRLELEKEAMANKQEVPKRETFLSNTSSEVVSDGIQDKYKLINVFGAGNQLQATVQDIANGQNKKLSVGKTLDGYTVKSISLDEGVVFVKGSDVQTLNVGSKD